MTEKVDLATNQVIRKVQASTYGAGIAAAVGGQFTPPLSDFLGNLIVRLVPFWDSYVGFLAVTTLLDLLFIGIFASTGALGAGYYVRSRSTDLAAKGPQ